MRYAAPLRERPPSFGNLWSLEQRYDAVREVLGGASVKDTATRYGIERRTLHRGLVRQATEGLGALADHSSKRDRFKERCERADLPQD